MRSTLLPLTIAAILLTACGGGDEHAMPADSTAASSAAAAKPASDVPLTGTIIEITMHTDDKGNYFEPAKLEARPGDVLRFKLVTGVHNVHFLPDSNPGHANLPAATAFAQLPGQTFDIPLTFGTGDFYFQCDPHAMLGMIGRLEVEKKD